LEFPLKKFRAKTDIFLSMCADSKSLGEDNDCTVKAIAITTGIPYKKVHETLKKGGRGDGKCATLSQMQNACLDLGFKMKNIPLETIKEKYPAAGRKLKSITTNHPELFNKAWKDGKNYILHCRGHVAAVIDGVNHDWTFGRKYRVNNIYEVVPAK